MKTLTRIAAAPLLLFAGSALADDKKIEPRFEDSVKLVLDPLDGAYGVKMKAAAVNPDRRTSKTEIALTFDFTKDVADLKALNRTFEASTGVPFRFDGLPLIFHLYDEDNVCVSKAIITAVEGDLTGVKGDAFRIFVSYPTDAFQRAKRIEARLYPLPK